jgi:hypothetical protein
MNEKPGTMNQSADVWRDIRQSSCTCPSQAAADSGSGEWLAGNAQRSAAIRGSDQLVTGINLRTNAGPRIVRRRQHGIQESGC